MLLKNLKSCPKIDRLWDRSVNGFAPLLNKTPWMASFLLNAPVILFNNIIHLLILSEAKSSAHRFVLHWYAESLFLLTTFCTTTGSETPQQWHNRLLINVLNLICGFYGKSECLISVFRICFCLFSRNGTIGC